MTEMVAADHTQLNQYATIRQCPQAAEKAYLDTTQNKHPLLLASCAAHHVFAVQLYTHKNALVRAACAQWPDLARYLYEDTSPYVRAACAQHEDIASLLLRDHSALVLSNIIERHEQLAFQLTGHPDAGIRQTCALCWATSASVLIDDSDQTVRSAALQY